MIVVRPGSPEDGGWIHEVLKRAWGSTQQVTRGRIVDASALPALVACRGKECVGLLTYRPDPASWEIVTLNSLQEGAGVGAALVAAVRDAARAAGCRRLWLVTSNDNLEALRFWQKRGFRLVAVHSGAVDRSRELKPEIPRVGRQGIPIRDEIELEDAPPGA